jgi:hypothetical protein
MVNKTITPHFIDSEEQLTFSPVEYSRFKYGSGNIGKKFADEIYPILIDIVQQQIKDGNRVVMYSSPYDYIPTATKTMAFHLYERLKESLSKNGNNLIWGKINRSTTYSIDYGELSAAQREELIGKDIFSLDSLPDKSDVLIFIDDIKITGTHEKVIVNMLSDLKINNISIFVYYAVLNNKFICPTIENKLNYAYVKDTATLLEVIHDSDFVYNTRVVKKILSLEAVDFEYFLDHTDNNIITQIFQLAKGNKYHLLDAYQKNLEKLSQLIGSAVSSN